MKYKEAMAIGSVVDGVIKCTWAMVYDAAGNKVYSLQNRNYSKDTTVAYYEGGNGDVKGGDVSLNLAFTQQRVFESVCTARTYVDGYKVPVTLNANVLSAFRQSVKNMQTQIERMEKIDATLVHPRYASYISGLKAGIELRQKQIADIEAGKEFWVKVKAFEWYPLNTQGISSEVEQAEAELKRAKQLLAASAVATVI